MQRAHMFRMIGMTAIAAMPAACGDGSTVPPRRSPTDRPRSMVGHLVHGMLADLTVEG